MTPSFSDLLRLTRLETLQILPSVASVLSLLLLVAWWTGGEAPTDGAAVVLAWLGVDATSVTGAVHNWMNDPPIRGSVVVNFVGLVAVLAGAVHVAAFVRYRRRMQAFLRDAGRGDAHSTSSTVERAPFEIRWGKFQVDNSDLLGLLNRSVAIILIAGSVAAERVGHDLVSYQLLLWVMLILDVILATFTEPERPEREGRRALVQKSRLVAVEVYVFVSNLVIVVFTVPIFLGQLLFYPAALRGRSTPESA